MEENLVFDFLKLNFTHAPLLLAYLLGMALALIKWRQHPLPSSLVFFASGLMFLADLAGTALSFYLVRARQDFDMGGDSLGWMLSVSALVRNVVHAAGGRAPAGRGVRQPAARRGPSVAPGDEARVGPRAVRRARVHPPAG